MLKKTASKIHLIYFYQQNMNSNTIDSFENNLTINNVSQIYLNEDLKITQDVLVILLILSIMIAMGHLLAADNRI